MSNPLKKQAFKKYQDIYEYNHSYCDFALETKPERKRIPLKKKNKKGGKKFLAMLLALTFLGSYGYFVCPYNFKSYFEPLYLNKILNNNIKIDAKELASPTKEYIHNSFFMGEYLLTPRAEKTKAITDIQIVSEMTDTKNKLLELAKTIQNLNQAFSFGNIHQALVWKLIQIQYFHLQV